MARKPDPKELIARERQLLADLLQTEAARAGLPATKVRRRALKLRKVSEHVERTWVSAGCFGEAVQWRLKGKK